MMIGDVVKNVMCPPEGTTSYYFPINTLRFIMRFAAMLIIQWLQQDPLERNWYKVK